MIDVLLSFLSGLAARSPEAATAVLAALPVTELRLSIPLGMQVFGLSLSRAFIFSLLGNAVPVLLLLRAAPLFLFFRRHCSWFERWYTKTILHFEAKHRASYQRYGSLFLFVFTAIPLPGSGVWSACLLAIIFDVKWRHALAAILAGMVMAGVIVSLIMSGFLKGLSFLL
jgi:uncharacterized membrane protein